MAGRLSANWWHEIKESTKWQDVIFFALCAAYALLSLVALVGPVTAICFTCFLIRCFVVVLSALDSDASLDVLVHPVLNLIYYTLVEILPSALVLYILRKLPPKRISAPFASPQNSSAPSITYRSVS